MILPQSRWEQVCKWFDDEERLAIHVATTGQPAMQRGFVIDETKVSPELRAKLKFHFQPPPVGFPARLARSRGAS